MESRGNGSDSAFYVLSLAPKHCFLTYDHHNTDTKEVNVCFLTSQTWVDEGKVGVRLNERVRRFKARTIRVTFSGCPRRDV
jgi:hypothetical protein